MQQVTANVCVETGFPGCNPGFVTTSEGIVMIDTPQFPSDAARWREELAKRGALRYLINTEPHLDHCTGNHFFPVTVMSHQGTREALSAPNLSDQIRQRVAQADPQGLPLMANYQLRLPSVTFSHSLTLYLGQHTFQMMHLPGHTPSEIAVYIPEERVVFTGDNVSYQIMPYMSESVPFQWLESLKRIEALEVDWIVPGHGEVCTKGFVPELASFIQECIDAVQKALEQGLSKEEAAERISFLGRYPMSPGREAFGPELQRMNVRRIYEVLAVQGRWRGS